MRPGTPKTQRNGSFTQTRLSHPARAARTNQQVTDMASDTAQHAPDTRAPAPHANAALCWREELDRALTGFEPTEQTLEKLIDWVERTR